MITWLLEKDMFHENQERLQASIVKNGHEFKVCDYVPFGGGIRGVDFDSLVNETFAFGSLQMIQHLQKKHSNGQLVSSETWKKDLKLIGFYDLLPSCMCVVSEPQNISAEWRFIVQGKEVITGSCYRRNNLLIESPSSEIDDEVMLYVDSVLGSVDFKPDPFWVLDICKNKEGHHVLEVGCMSSCGLYGCDVDLIVNSIGEFFNVGHIDEN